MSAWLLLVVTGGGEEMLGTTASVKLLLYEKPILTAPPKNKNKS